MRRFAILGAVIMSCLLSKSMHGATTPAGKCPDSGQITASCFLDRSFHDPITIAGSDVTLDCRGHDVSSPFAKEMRNGISVNGWRNVTIANCNVIGWNAGVRVDNATFVKLTDNVVSGNDDGYDINGSRQIYIIGGVAMFNTGDGIDLDDDVFVSITQVNIVHNIDKGITVNTKPGGSGNTQIYVLENRLSDNGTGIRLEAVSRGMICGNGFAKNAGGNVVRKPNVAAVTESDSRLDGHFGVCLAD